MCLHLTNEFPSSLHFFCWGIKNNAMTGLLKEIPTKKNLIRLNYENQIRLIEQNEMSEKSNIFLKPISELELSVRIVNGFKYLNIQCFGDLVQETEYSLLRIPNFGRKSLTEIKDVLENISLKSGLDIYLGMEIDWSKLEDPKIKKKEEEKKSDFLKDNLKKLLLPIDKIEFSVRTLNCIKNDNIICIGDLVQKNELEMLRNRNFGKKSINEVKEILQKKSLYLGMKIPNWPPENYEKLVKSYDISSDIKFDFYSLKEILDKKFNDREKIIYDQRFSRGKTLEFIGKKFNITRERVRQIEAKLIRRVLKYKDAFKNFLSSERNYIFSKLSNNSNLITYRTLKNYKNKNLDLMTDKDFFIKFCIFIVYKNKTNFLNEEYCPITINEFIQRKTTKRSRIKYVQAWKKEKKIQENKKVNSGIFKLYKKRGNIYE